MRITTPSKPTSNDTAREFNLQIAACSLRTYAREAARLSGRFKKKGHNRYGDYCDRYAKAFTKLAAMISR